MLEDKNVKPVKGYVVGGMSSSLFFRIVGFLAAIWKYRKKKLLHNDYKKIIVVKLGGIGDAILATPLLKPLKDAYPEAAIGVVTWTPSVAVYRNNEFVDLTFSSPLLDVRTVKGLLESISLRELYRIKSFFKDTDLIIFLNRIDSIMGSIKLAMLACLSDKAIRLGLDTSYRGFFLDYKITDGGYFIKHEVEWVKDVLDMIGIQVNKEELKTYLNVPREDNIFVTELIDKYSIKNYIVMHIGSSQESWRGLKRIDIDVWRALIEKITARYNISVLLVGTKVDGDANKLLITELKRNNPQDERVFNFAGLTTLSQLTDLISRASLFIGTDSGVAHVASCADRPIITIFGFSDFIGFKPWSKKSFVVRKDLNCSPCIYRKGYMDCNNRKCLGISSEDIYRKVVESIDIE